MKRLLVFFAFVVLFLSFTSTADAAVFTKDSDKNIRINVLGVSTNSNNLTSIATSLENIVSKINLNFSDNKLVLSYKTENSDREFNLNEFEGEVVEIKKEKEEDSLMVLSEDEKFRLQQRGIWVETNFPVEVDSNLENLTLKTASGNRYLNVLPYDAVTPLIKTKLLDEIDSEGKIELIELDAGELSYYIQGQKSYSLFDLFSVKADVGVNVSALSGDVLSIDQPVWSRILNFLQV